VRQVARWNPRARKWRERI